MNNPYSVLGVSPNASDDEIKKAYRTLSRKYHPDANVNNPNKAQAEERFKQVQEAYEQIMKDKQRGQGGAYSSGTTYDGDEAYRRQQQAQQNGGYGQQGYGGYGQQGTEYWDPFGFGGFGPRGGSYTYNAAPSSSDSPQMRRALEFIRAQRYREAINILDAIPERNGRWYYFASVANAGCGNNVTALELARKAVQLEPSNTEYRRFMEQLESSGNWYNQQGSSYRGVSINPMMCISMLCLCNMLGGGFCFYPRFF